MTKHTPGPWEAIALGGASTVIMPAKPAYFDPHRVPYAYDEDRGFCVGEPFIEDDGRTRLDFVCFSHEDARLIAAAPELYGALKFILAFYEEGQTYLDTEAWKCAEASGRAALLKARGHD